MATYKFVNADQLDADLQTVANKIREKAELSNQLSFPSGFVDGIDQCSSLNFSVVGGTTQPNNPKENTIWVNTSTTITSWAFSATEPAAPEEGMVWFPLGTSSPAEFNALKKNAVQVYPLSAKQYVDGAWVDRTAKSYQNGTWNDWIVHLVVNGVFTDGSSWEWATTEEGSVIEIADNCLHVSCGATGSSRAWSEKTYNFTGKSKLVFYCPKAINENSSNIGEFHFGVSSTKNDNSFAAVAIKKAYTDTEGQYVEVDVSGLTGAYYVKVAVIRASAYYTDHIYVQNIDLQ